MASRLKQSFSFHSSPEAFIYSRQQALINTAESKLNGLNTHSIVRAEILNRNVHIVSSYTTCNTILNSSAPSDSPEDGPTSEDATRFAPSPGEFTPSTFASGPAYKELMADFFPLPNLLIEDGPTHKTNKAAWKSRLNGLQDEGVQLVREITENRLVNPLLTQASDGAHIDLYETLKHFAWDLLLGIFLKLDRNDDRQDFELVEHLQERLLRGQFSLFPIKIWTPIWRSARSSGIEATKSLEPVLRRRWEVMNSDASEGGETRSGCPFMRRMSKGEGENECITFESATSHLRLFTSSISNKALSSLLTAYFANLFLWRPGDRPSQTSSLAKMVSQQSDPQTRKSMLTSILLETERLSPPVVGVMRRVLHPISLSGSSEGSQHSVPAGHDVWLYLVGANRDESVFSHANEFMWDRFMGADASSRQGLAFGGGGKECLGALITRDICFEVADVVLTSMLKLEGEISQKGVREWLGWDDRAGFDSIARDMKQLPCQRPREPIMVKVARD